MLGRPDAIVFDLDGTLVDTVPARIRGWREVLAEREIEIGDDRLKPMIGMDGRRLAREAAAAAGRRLSDDEAEEIDRLAGLRFDRHNRPVPLPGARELLERLDAVGITWAIATSSRPEQVAASVAALERDHRPRIVDGSRVAHAKPAPDLLLLSAAELGLPPERCWYVGDSTWDMAAAAAAGMPAIGVLAGAAVDERSLREAGADVVVATLDRIEIPVA